MDFGSGGSIALINGPGNCTKATCATVFLPDFGIGGCEFPVTFYDFNPTPTPHFDSRPGNVVIGITSLGASVVECSGDSTMTHSPKIVISAGGGFGGMCVLSTDVWGPHVTTGFQVVGNGEVSGCDGGQVALGPSPDALTGDPGINPLFQYGAADAAPWCGDYGCIDDPKPACSIPLTKEIQKCSGNISYYIEVQTGVDGSGNPIFTPETGTLAGGPCAWNGGTLTVIKIATAIAKPNGDKCCPPCDCQKCGNCGDGSQSAPCDTCWAVTVGSETVYLGTGSCPLPQTISGTKFQNLTFGFVEGCA